MQALQAKHLKGITEHQRAEKSREYQTRVSAHIAAISGFPHVGAYLAASTVPDADKEATLKVLGRAVLKEDWSELKGENPKGQAEEPGDTPDPQPAPVQGEGNTEQQTQLPQPTPPPVVVNHGDDEAEALQTLAKALKRFMPAAPSVEPAKLDEGRVKEILDASLSPIRKLIDELSGRQAPPRAVIEIVKDGKAIKTIDGLSHWQLPQVATWVQANVPVWLWGQAGGGKTTLAYQLADALSLTPTVISIDPTMTVGKMMGFKNMANGEFCQGFAYLPYRDGGLLFLDEIDTGDPGILASTNALVANDRYLFPNGETVKRHKDFRVVAGGNTKGCGAVAGYTARNRLDAATLDRFAVIELTYDQSLTESIIFGEPITPLKSWAGVKDPSEDDVRKYVNYWKAVSAQIASGYGGFLLSPRAAILGARAIRAGVPVNEVVDALIFKLVGSDTRATIESSCGRLS